jgi:hypothetical protein
MSKGKLPRHALNGTRILIVDDEEILAWSIETELKSNGADVMPCSTLRSTKPRPRSCSAFRVTPFASGWKNTASSNTEASPARLRYNDRTFP